MSIVYYRTGSGKIPVKEYFSKFDLRRDIDRKKLIKVRSVIEMSAQNKGIPGGKFSGIVRGHNYQALKIPTGERTIRILYFMFSGETLVLLNAFDKPARYDEKAERRRVNRDVEPVYEETELFYQDFLLRPNQYEKYE